MLTTCPECRTTFRIDQTQLDDKRGLVRCGHCAAVFNAYDTLLPELTAPPREEAGPVEEKAPAAPKLERVVDIPDLPPPVEAPAGPADRGLAFPEDVPEEVLPPSGVMESESQSAPEGPSEDSGAPDAPSVTPVFSEAAPDLPAEPEPEARPEHFTAAEDILFTPMPGAGQPPAEQVWPRRLAWGLVSLLLLAVLALQLAYFLRAELVSAVPGLRGPMENACARLGCSLPLARDLAALRIEASSLETDPEDTSRATLHTSLSNRSNQPLAWPHLVLVLTDTRDVPIAQRPFAPAEYLTDKALVAAGIQPDQEREISLELELKGLSAYGYKLEMHFP